MKKLLLLLLVSLASLLILPVGMYAQTGLGGGLFSDNAGGFTSVAFAGLGSPANSKVRYCTNCNPNTFPCTGGGSGAFAYRIGGAWICPSTAASSGISQAAADARYVKLDGSSTMTGNLKLGSTGQVQFQNSFLEIVDNLGFGFTDLGGSGFRALFSDLLLTADRVYTLPNAAGTLVLTTATQTLTNKSIAGSEIDSGTVPAARLGTMTGDSGAGGASGAVPAPAAGDAAALKFFKADGTWATVSSFSAAGSGSELQARSNGTTLQAVTGSSTSNGGITLAPTASTSPIILTGVTQTASAPLISAAQTWNNAAVQFVGNSYTFTNTASDARSKLVDYSLGATSFFSIRRSGWIDLGGAADASGVPTGGGLLGNPGGNGGVAFSSGGGTQSGWFSGSDFRVFSTGQFCFSGDSSTAVSGRTSCVQQLASGDVAIGTGTQGTIGGRFNSLAYTANINATAKTANYTTTATDFTILANTTGGAFTITLSSTNARAGQIYMIKMTATSANALTLSPSSGNIDGGASSTITPTTVKEGAMVQFDGTNWWIVGTYSGLL